ncbi:MAG: hypothetical protein LUF25_05770 [Phascolarctobacterium sp.]|nr:hypothetical protein [Phascolarctobacterium sp.]
MKIRKNLSDEEMFRGRREKLTFENGIHADGQSHHTKKTEKTLEQKEILLPDEVRERLNRFLLEVRMEWMKDKKGNCRWKITKENDRITIIPVASKSNGILEL